MKFQTDLLRAIVAPVAIMAIAPVAQAQVQPAPLDAYGDLPNIQDAALSLEGKLALLTVLDGKRVVLVLDEQMKPLNLIEVGDIKVRGIEWAGEDTVLVMRTDTQELGDRFIADKSEFSNTMIVPTDPANPVRTVFADTRSMTNATFGSHGLRKMGGKWYGFYGGIALDRTTGGGNYVFNGGSPALYRVDLATNEPKRVTTAPNSGESSDWLLDAEGNIAAESLFVGTSRKLVIRNAGGKVIHEQVYPDSFAGLVAFSPDGQSAIFWVDPEEGSGQWFTVPLAGGEVVEYLPDDPVEAAIVDPLSGRLLGYYPDVDTRIPTFLDEEMKTVGTELIKGFGTMNAQIVGWSSGFDRVLVRTRGNGDAGSWFMVNTVDKSSKVIGRERPLIKPGMVGKVSMVDYTASDGLELNGVLTLPPGIPPENLPLVMLPHGGPHAHDSVTFDWWAQAFASRGYAVFQPNFRGSTNLDEAFSEMSYGQWGAAMQTDLSDGIAYLAQQGIVDPDRVCIVGASYGGYAALAGVTIQNGVYRCAVSVAGVSDIAMLFDQDVRESGRNRFVKESRLEEFGPREIHKERSPRHLADRADAPVLLIHGRDDIVVPYKHSTVMYEALKKEGKDVRLVELESEDHWLSRAATRKQMLSETVAFVMEHNPPN